MKVWLVVGVAVVLLAGAGFWHYSRQADTRRGEDVQKRLDEALDAGATVKADTLADFDFDRLVVFYGVDTPNTINNRLGFDWRRSDDLGYECCDPPPLWVFVEGDEVVAYLRPEPAEVSNNRCVTAGHDYGPSSVLRIKGCS